MPLALKFVQPAGGSVNDRRRSLPNCRAMVISSSSSQRHWLKTESPKRSREKPRGYREK
jgi:hypothetical protein